MRSYVGLGIVLVAGGLAGAAAGCGGSTVKPAAPPAPAHDARPTEARCREVVTRLGQLLPKDFPDVESDTQDCLALPAGVVECLAEVKAEADLDGCVRTFCQEKPRACPRIEASWTPRPTHAECERAFDHLRELRGGEGAAPEDARGQFVEDCVAEGHKRDVDCILEAGDLNAVSRCANDAPRAE